MNKATTASTTRASGEEQEVDEELLKVQSDRFTPFVETRQKSIDASKQKLIEQMKTVNVMALPFPDKEDELHDRFEIDMNKPLLDFTRGKVKAYHARDKNADDTRDIELYAVICQESLPIRHHVLEALKDLKNSHIVRTVDHGVVKISIYDEYRYVLVFEKPKGTRLSSLLKQNKHLSADGIIRQILTPIATILMELDQKGISHGCINPDNIFIGDRTILGECISEPSGRSQEFIYEPPERMTCTPYGKGESGIQTDSYALGVLTIECLFGLNKIRKIGMEALYEYINEVSAYTMFTTGRTISDIFSDFLLGTLTHNVEERWDSEQVSSWLNGKRFNLIHVTFSREASRPFEFMDKPYHSRVALAVGYRKHWTAAKEMVRKNPPTRWLDQVINKKDLSRQIDKAVVITGGDHPKKSGGNDDLLARALMILDPQGPIRLQHIAFHLTGIGNLFSHAFLEDDVIEMNQIKQAFSFELIKFYSEMRPDSYNEYADVLWRIDAAKQYIKASAIGFGIERIFYDVNDHTACASPMLREYVIRSNHELLYTLDHISRQKTENDSLVDRHIASFSASRMKMNTPATFRDIGYHPELALSQELQVIRILGNAQKKEHIPYLYGLAHWCAIRAIPLLEYVHNDRIRESMTKNILRGAEEGNINLILETITSKRLLDNDAKGFNRARLLFIKNHAKIHYLKNTERLRNKSSAVGSTIAATLSFGALLYMSYRAIMQFI